MGNESKQSSAEIVEHASLPNADGSQSDQSEIASNQKTEHSRKNALSKREIMEQLSRERFPWDE
jgi:hypothetical protein